MPTSKKPTAAAPAAPAGGGAVMVSEEKRMEFARKLQQLRDSPAAELAFPASLSNNERRYLHKMAQEFGLNSKSSGKGDKRCIVVAKKATVVQKLEGEMVTAEAAEAIPELKIDVAVQKLLSNDVLAAVANNPHYKAMLSNVNRSENKGSGSSDDRCEPTDGKSNSSSSNNSYIKPPVASAVYFKAQRVRQQHPQYDKLQTARSKLPAFHHRLAVTQLVKQHPIVLISGETGCGKSTQVPQFLFDDPEIGPCCRIAVTQPRRISAVAVAERIASERSESLHSSSSSSGGSGASSVVGYSIRLDSSVSSNTQIVFLTPGVLLRKLQNDPLLLEFTHIIVDEAHERDRFSEFLQIILRDISARRSNNSNNSSSSSSDSNSSNNNSNSKSSSSSNKINELRLVLMSATMHTHKIRAYFGDIPQINIGGSVFPVQEFFLEHALQFTGFGAELRMRNAFLGNSNSNSNNSRNNSNSNKRGELAALLRGQSQSASAATAANDLFCSTCAAGPFKSPEELGTHAALCYAAASTREQAVVDLAANNNSSSGSNARGGQQPQQRVQSLAARVLMLANSSSNNSAVSIASRLAELDAQAAVAAAAATSTLAAVKAELDTSVAAAVDESKLVTDADDEEVADCESDAGSDNSRNYDALDAAVSAAAGVDTADLLLDKQQILSEESPELDALLRDYQSAFDDSSVDYELLFKLLKYVLLESEFTTTSSSNNNSNSYNNSNSSGVQCHGSVLCFLPGWDDISRMRRLLASSAEFGDERVCRVIQLHSGISKRDQEKVFQKAAPGQYKIILSTNIAETSLTIEDVAVVIDSGRMKEQTYDPHTKLACLQSAWISKASARQRRGRAGRTQAGVCFHLYSTLRARHLAEHQDSELLRMPLEELVLQAKSLGVAPGKGGDCDSISSFLLKAMDPPHLLSISNAISLLKSIDCLTTDEELTAVGALVSRLPLNPRMGRMLLFSCLFGCAPALLSAAAAMGYRDPFVLPASDAQRAQCTRVKQRLANGSQSDQIAVLNAMNEFSRLMGRLNVNSKSNALSAGGGYPQQLFRFCDDNFLSFSTMVYLNELAQQLRNIMRDANINMAHASNLRNDGNLLLVLSCVALGLYPAVAVRKRGAKVFVTEKICRARIHSSSINASAPRYRNECSSNSIEAVGYQDLIASGGGNSQPSFVRGRSVIGGADYSMLSTTPISMLAILLFAGRMEILSVASDPFDAATVSTAATATADGGARESQSQGRGEKVVVLVDQWLALRLSRFDAQCLLRARTALSVGLYQYLQNPQKALSKDVGLAVHLLGEALSYCQRHA